jgi:hypothetical protein
MAGTGNVIGWKLPDEERSRLLERFPPCYERTIADHVTLEVGVPRTAALPHEQGAKVVGRADDGDSLECLVVEIGGTTDRPDGSTYHITWSLGPERKAKESNDVLRDLGWDPIDNPIPIALKPARF